MQIYPYMTELFLWMQAMHMHIYIYICNSFIWIHVYGLYSIIIMMVLWNCGGLVVPMYIYICIRKLIRGILSLPIPNRN